MPAFQVNNNNGRSSSRLVHDSPQYEPYVYVFYSLAHMISLIYLIFYSIFVQLIVYVLWLGAKITGHTSHCTEHKQFIQL